MVRRGKHLDRAQRAVIFSKALRGGGGPGGGVVGVPDDKADLFWSVAKGTLPTHPETSKSGGNGNKQGCASAHLLCNGIAKVR